MGDTCNDIAGGPVCEYWKSLRMCDTPTTYMVFECRCACGFSLPPSPPPPAPPAVCPPDASMYNPDPITGVSAICTSWKDTGLCGIQFYKDHCSTSCCHIYHTTYGTSVANTEAPTVAPTVAPPPGVVPTCPSGQTSYTATMTVKEYGSEITWDIDGGATEGPYDNAAAVHTKALCLAPGSHTAHMKDSYGDGWHGGTLVIEKTSTGTTVVNEGLSDGTATKDVTFTVGSAGGSAGGAGHVHGGSTASPTPALTASPTPAPTASPTPAPTTSPTSTPTSAGLCRSFCARNTNPRKCTWTACAGCDEC